MYYVRRDGRIKGPLSREKLRSLRQEKRLRMRDEIATTADGPWHVLRDVREAVLGAGALPSGEASPPFDSGIWSDQAGPAPLTPAGGAAAGEQEPDGEWQDTLRAWLEGDDPFRGPFRPGMYILGALLLVVLGVLALSVVFGTH